VSAPPSEGTDVICFDALVTLAEFELDLLASYERPTTGSLDIREVNEDIVSAFLGDESKSLFVVKKFYGTGWHD